MIEQVNGRYINRYAELDKPFTVKGTQSYTSKTTGVIYESMILTQDGADFNFSVADTEIGAMKNFIGKDIYILRVQSIRQIQLSTVVYTEFRAYPSEYQVKGSHGSCQGCVALA